MMHTQPHERFSAVLALAPGATGAFARVVGDSPPAASRRRFCRNHALWPGASQRLANDCASDGADRGEIIDLRGRIHKQNGETAVGAKGRVLVTANL